MTDIPEHPRIVELMAQRQRALDASSAASSAGFAADHGWVDPQDSAALDAALETERRRLKEVVEGVRRDHADLYAAWVARGLAAAERSGDWDLTERWKAVQRGDRDDVVFARL